VVPVLSSALDIDHNLLGDCKQKLLKQTVYDCGVWVLSTKPRDMQERLQILIIEPQLSQWSSEKAESILPLLASNFT